MPTVLPTMMPTGIDTVGTTRRHTALTAKARRGLLFDDPIAGFPAATGVVLVWL